jgi:hypothetical protein
MLQWILTIVLAVGCAGLAFLVIRERKRVGKLSGLVGGFEADKVRVADLEKQALAQAAHMKKARESFDRKVRAASKKLSADLVKRKHEQEAALARTRADAQAELARLKDELVAVSRDLAATRVESDLQSFGMYEAQYDFETSEEYKEKLEATRESQKTLIRDDQAATCSKEWTVEGSKAKGGAMVRKHLKLLLRAFNGECDAAISRVKYNNVVMLRKRMRHSFDAINKLGEEKQCTICVAYLRLKIDELHLAHEYQEKRQAEREEQREIREQMREEERVRREVEKARQQAEEEERQYEKALKKAQEDIGKASAQQKQQLSEQIAQLEQQISEAHTNRERAISRAQLTRSGHVYVISNIGSFGDNVYKVGLTRRLIPEERVKELGDASVPFTFDVHAMIYSEDAPSLERAIHADLDSRRVNLVNSRKEFFVASLAEIERVVLTHCDNIRFTKVAEAEDFRKSMAIRREQKSSSRDGTWERMSSPTALVTSLEKEA